MRHERPLPGRPTPVETVNATLIKRRLAGAYARETRVEIGPNQPTEDGVREVVIADMVELLDQGRLPIVRGLALTRDDLLRRAVIMSLMCQGELQFESIELGHLIDFRQHFARELEVLEGLAEHGLVRLDATGVQVTETGWYLVRAIAMVFDKHLQVDLDRARFSKII